MCVPGRRQTDSSSDSALSLLVGVGGRGVQHGQGASAGGPHDRPYSKPSLPFPTVYKTKLVKIELLDDFDEYTMTIEQVIKSGTQPSCLPASPAQLPLLGFNLPFPAPQAQMRCRQGRNGNSSATSSAEMP